MANRRWTVMLVPHGSDGSKALSLSGTVVKLVAGVATVVAASMLAATIGVVSHSVDLARSQRLERANEALASEVQRLNSRVGVLSDTLVVISRRDEEMRLVAGLEPLSPDVERAGIGGPAGPWPEREQLLTEGGTAGRQAFSVHTDLDALIRRANLLATSFQEAAESIAAHTQEMAAMPSIMPTMGFLTSKFSLIRYHPDPAREPAARGHRHHRRVRHAHHRAGGGPRAQDRLRERLREHGRDRPWLRAGDAVRAHVPLEAGT